MKKFTPLTWIIAGLSLGLAALSYGYFSNYAPNMVEKEAFDAHKKDLEDVIAMDGRAKKRVADVAMEVSKKSEEWQAIVDQKTPQPGLKYGGIDLSVNAWQLVVDAPTFRDSMQAAVNRQVLKGGVKVISAPVVPAFSQDATKIVSEGFNYPALPFPIVMYDLGTIQVRGTMNQIMDNFEAWSRMPNYMAISAGLQFTGTTPVLTGTYNVTMVGYVQGSKIGASVPEGGGSAAGGSGGGNAPGGGLNSPGGPQRVGKGDRNVK
ncbi:MAG: hypothetical protein K8R88_10565 [Armatimonadetes bacterium]|nr:hypothetical protein [Armatimonadota bacterium]